MQENKQGTWWFWARRDPLCGCKEKLIGEQMKEASTDHLPIQGHGGSRALWSFQTLRSWCLPSITIASSLGASLGPSPLSPAYLPLRTKAGITPGSPMVSCRVKQGSGSSVGKGSARAHLRPGSCRVNSAWASILLSQGWEDIQVPKRSPLCFHILHDLG